MVDFKNLKKNRAAAFEKLQEYNEQLNDSGFEKDPDDWYPGVDKAGNGLAIIRFLPAINDDDLDYVRWWEHNFQDPTTKKWYIENCLYTLNKGKDPVMEFNKKLWDSVEDSESAKEHPNRKQATRQARKTNYRANIFVIDDTVNPEHNGKAKKFQYGKWCQDKIDALIFPKFAGKTKINPFDLWDGANFVIEVTSEMKGGKKQRNYSTSHFENPGALADDKTMEEIFNSIQGWSLKEYLNPSRFKPYADLKKRLDEVVGFDTAKWTPNGIRQTVREPEAQPKQSTSVAAKQQKEVQASEQDESEDFFNNLKDDAIPF